MPLYLGNKLVSGQTRPIDGAVTQDSKNLITSGAVKTYVDDIVDDLATEIPIQDQEPAEGNLWIDTSENGATITPEEIGAVTQEQLNEAIAAIPTPDVSGQIGLHDSNPEAHSSIREAVGRAQSTANEAWQMADGRVPVNRKINGKMLAEDITLGASDIGAPTVAEMNAAVASKAPMYDYGTADLTAGTSPLETGKLYFVYE